MAGMPICLECVHLRDDLRKFCCDAFPEGIPEAIVTSVVDHQVPVPGDHDIQFEPKYPARVGAYTANPLLRLR
jgi:hypothetical protein